MEKVYRLHLGLDSVADIVQAASLASSLQMGWDKEDVLVHKEPWSSEVISNASKDNTNERDYFGENTYARELFRELDKMDLLDELALKSKDFACAVDIYHENIFKVKYRIYNLSLARDIKEGIIVPDNKQDYEIVPFNEDLNNSDFDKFQNYFWPKIEESQKRLSKKELQEDYKNLISIIDCKDRI